MTQDDFIRAVESELQLLGVPFDRSDLLNFAEDVWPLAEDDPDPGMWAREFLQGSEGATWCR